MASVINGSYEILGGRIASGSTIYVHAFCPKCGRNVTNFTCGPSSVNAPARHKCRCSYCSLDFTVTVIND